MAGQREYTRVLALAGGLPIMVGDDVIGAVGVSGPPRKDDDCSKAGIERQPTNSSSSGSDEM